MHTLLQIQKVIRETNLFILLVLDANFISDQLHNYTKYKKNLIKKSFLI